MDQTDQTDQIDQKDRTDTEIKAVCRRCGADDIILFEQVMAQMPEYIKAVAEDLRVSDEEYRARLAHCYECEGLSGGLTCKYCGCFVQMRAIKKHMRCPSPLTGRW
jgi:hypothetical protein